MASAGSRPRERHLYVAPLNPKPIVLRGGGLGGEAAEASGGAVGSGARARKAAPDLSASTGLESGSTAGSVATPATTPPGSTRAAHCLSIATPVRGDGANSDDSCHDVNQKLQETYARLSALEAEHRQIFDSSVGALMKVASTLQGCKAGTSKSSGSRACAKQLTDVVATAADITALTASSLQTTGVLLGRATSAVASSVTTTPSSSSLLGETQGHLSALSEFKADTGRLEDENRMLREAVVRAQNRNAQLAAQHEDVEARCRQLQEENQRTAQVIPADDDGPVAASRQATAQGPVAASQAPAAAPAVPAAIVDSREAEARNALFRTNAEVERRLQSLLSRRGHLQELASPAAAAQT